MSHSELCPVCNGRGWVIIEDSCGTALVTETCHGCNGTGWVVVPDAYTYYITPRTTLWVQPDA